MHPRRIVFPSVNEAFVHVLHLLLHVLLVLRKDWLQAFFQYLPDSKMQFMELLKPEQQVNIWFHVSSSGAPHFREQLPRLH